MRTLMGVIILAGILGHAILAQEVQPPDFKNQPGFAMLESYSLSEDLEGWRALIDYFAHLRAINPGARDPEQFDEISKYQWHHLMGPFRGTMMEMISREGTLKERTTRMKMVRDFMVEPGTDAAMQKFAGPVFKMLMYHHTYCIFSIQNDTAGDIMVKHDGLEEHGLMRSGEKRAFTLFSDRTFGATNIDILREPSGTPIGTAEVMWDVNCGQAFRVSDGGGVEMIDYSYSQSGGVEQGGGER